MRYATDGRTDRVYRGDLMEFDIWISCPIVYFQKISMYWNFCPFLGFCLGKGPDPFVTALDHCATLQAGILQTMMHFGMCRATDP